jgi:hypothetical protein
MRRAFPFLSALAFTLLFSARTQAQTSIGVTPGWLRDLGSGQGGDYSCTSGQCNLGEEQWFSSFNVSAGATVFTAGNGPIIIRSTGACTIAGTLAATPNDNPGLLGVSNAGDFGGGGGGGGGGTAAGQFGVTTVGVGGSPIVPGGLSGAPFGGNGGTGATTNPPQYRPLLSGGSFWPVGGSRGGRGGSSGGLGGQGGMTAILICNSINFTGTIDVSGAAGSPAPANSTGAGGGGGGGYVILSAFTYTANSGVINVSGGPGGSCNGRSGCGAGGTGGNGWSIAIAIQ